MLQFIQTCLFKIIAYFGRLVRLNNQNAIHIDYKQSGVLIIEYTREEAITHYFIRVVEILKPRILL